jgi:hypothetical protein
MGQIQDDIKELKELIRKQTEEKGKGFKLPFGKKVGKAQKRKNYVTVLILYENGMLDFKKYQIEDQTIMHDIIPRLASAGHVMYWKKNPFIILPNWSVEPFSPLEHYQKSLLSGSNSIGYKLLLAKMLREQINAKKPVSGIVKWIIGIGLAAIIGYALITGGG